MTDTTQASIARPVPFEFSIGRWASILVATSVLLLAVAEIGLRFAGAADYPLYNADAVVGYQPKPNQSGAYLNTYTYAFNEKGMGVAAPFKPSPDDILLIGDSIVMGPKYLRQTDRLGPLLQARTGKRVWPMGAVSWAFENELAWLNAHPEAQVPQNAVIVSNWLDFGPPSVWVSEQRNPRSAPLSALARTIQARFADKSGQDPTHPTTDQTKAWTEALNTFMSTYKGHVTFVAYPVKPELTGELSGQPRQVAKTFGPYFEAISKLSKDRVSVINLAENSDWRTALYHDDIHPNAAAMPILANAIAGPLSFRDTVHADLGFRSTSHP